MRGIVIAGTHSGCGKTTVTLGIMAALRKRRLAVQPFKAGPDFIDAGLHRLVADRPSRNLDLWMCGQDYVTRCFRKHAADADIAVIEGVMGMHDGDRSTASLAMLLQVPVVLVVDAYGMAESAGAVVRGFAEFRENPPNPPLAKGGEGGLHYSALRTPNSTLSIAGVIFNRVASESHFARLRDSVRNVPVLGYLPREMDFEIPHRHLGLTTAEENPLADRDLDKLAETVLTHVDVDQLLQNARIEDADTDLERTDSDHPSAKRGKRFTLAVAFDKAFSFYYEDNLDLLRDAGAEIIRFSPLADMAIPGAADGVYIGGGYPELHAAALSGNISMCESVRAWVDAGKPLYAECGGLMYLSQGIRDFDNAFFAMAGVFPFETRMMKKPRLGYREIVLNEDCILGSKGEKYRGHEFHYSEIVGDASGSVYAMSDSRNKVFPTEGFRRNNTLASYVHIHFGSNQRRADQFAGFIKGEQTA
ncbi:MAG: cobyrinate a,c-diamide synthase [Nitrospirae bacterium]|nr:cobyrinate a,c-diamide synthase [Nitrospirota bacterium]